MRVERTYTLIVAALLLAGCAPERVPVRPAAYEIDVELDPAASTLRGRATIELALLDDVPADDDARQIELKLHPELSVESVLVDGDAMEFDTRRNRRTSGDEDDAVVPSSVLITVVRPPARLELELAYAGRLWQDVEAGEEEGEVHNFAVSAHIGEEGIFLEPDGYWYPRIDTDDGDDPALGLSDYRLVTDPVEGFELVAGLERGDADDGRLHWSSPFPHDGLVLLGGPLERHSRVHDGITLHAVLAPGKGAVADDILDASAEYLDRYRPLIGPYPFTEFTVLEAFFSSGFAFPTCTQIAGSQLSEHRQYRRHGYLDHELLHNWWGNGILVDPDDGNWCEGLASYMGNYYGYVLDGDDVGARKQRRNFSNFLSAIEENDDKPLGTFGEDDGAGRGIGYQKGAAVFHMLERRIGRDALHTGLRLLTEERMGTHIGWAEIEEAMARASGDELSAFFEQWVRRGGAPRLDLTAVDWTPGETEVRVSLSQGESEFELDVPLRLYYGNRFDDVTVRLETSGDELAVPCRPAGLTAVELDPDYHLFRKLAPGEAMPTSSLTHRSDALVIVLPDGEISDAYRTVADSFRDSVLGDDDEPEEGHTVVERAASEVTAEDLEAAGVLLLGDAVHAPAVASLLERTRSPVRWEAGAFGVGETRYSKPGEAVFFTVHHPDRPDLGVTVYHGNSEAALSNAGVLSYYPNSLLVFDTPAGVEAVDASGMPRARVVERVDLEFHDRVELR